MYFIVLTASRCTATVSWPGDLLKRMFEVVYSPNDVWAYVDPIVGGRFKRLQAITACNLIKYLGPIVVYGFFYSGGNHVSDSLYRRNVLSQCSCKSYACVQGNANVSHSLLISATWLLSTGIVVALNHSTCPLECWWYSLVVTEMKTSLIIRVVRNLEVIVGLSCVCTMNRILRLAIKYSIKMLETLVTVIFAVGIALDSSE